MSEFAFLSVSEAGRLIEAGELSPVDLTEALLAWIAKLDPHYNAFIAITAEEALAQARQAEAELARGGYRGPLHGIPYGLKDIFDVAGMRTTCHSRVRLDASAAARDATVVARLRESGAVLLGKLALHEFATGGPAFDLPWPPARNAWNRDLHPGGSSSGSATAVALGMVPAALGTDTGGSVRNPATCSNLVGMKPTYGAVSRAGVFPLSFSLDHVGPITRTVEDNAIMLDALAAPDPADPTSVRVPWASCRAELRAGVKGLRIAVLHHFFREDAPAEPDQVRAFEDALAVLRDLGAELAPMRVSPLSVWVDCGRIIHQSEAFAIHQQDLSERPEDFAAITRGKLLPGAFIPASRYVQAQQWRGILVREFEDAMQGWDAAVTLSSLALPCRIDDAEAVAKTYERQCRMPFNVTGTPALAVPTGFSHDGVPLGMQIVGRAFGEPMLYRIAYALCEATGLTERRPPALASQLERSSSAKAEDPVSPALTSR